ncbi:hypothetical protein A3L04_00060 [Thermococcus chitonophagus]|uniref:Uncharacterized protein n=1 Tax=Thermococcus chitonophagus TaxID=54262 RepID=A0A2Z2N5Y5_9EURY|nr:hypothetical protein A3L04_00060 [Thermococcus chitonophagus]
MSEEIKVIRESLARIERRLEVVEKMLEELLEQEEIYSLMKLSEDSLEEFFSDEPDIYSEKDLKVRYYEGKNSSR